MELRSKGKPPPLPPTPLPPTIRSMALAYQGKAQTMEVILKAAQSHPVDQRVNIYHGLTQVILNQEHNVVEAAKNAMIEIEKDGELKGNLESKEWENAFADIRKLSKITHKIDEIKTVRDTVSAANSQISGLIARIFSLAVDTPDTRYQDTRVSADTIADTPIRIRYCSILHHCHRTPP